MFVIRFLRWIWSLFEPMDFDQYKSPEAQILDRWRKDPATLLDELIWFIGTEAVFTSPESLRWLTMSSSGRIVIAKDIYGYEIKIDDGPLLDASPSFYGLTWGEAERLSRAIIARIPGGSAYHDLVTGQANQPAAARLPF